MKQVWMKAGCVMAAAAALSTSAYAADPAACRNVRFADVGWTDIAATTGLASTVFEGLGYHPVKTIASVPITFTGIKSKQIDVFLGYWSPTMDPIVAPAARTGSAASGVTPSPRYMPDPDSSTRKATDASDGQARPATAT